jgi:hypothetical protein
MNRGGAVWHPVEFETPGIGHDEPGDDIEKRGFAGPIGTDQAINLTALDMQSHIVEGLKTAEPLADAFNE